MKIIHTFKPLEKGKTLEDNAILSYMAISAICAKKHWGNIHLYCDEESKKIVEEVGIPYTSINTELFEKYDFGSVFSIPKIKVFEAQTEPFLHIDYDTFFFERRPLEDHYRVIYSHPDFNFISYFDEIRSDVVELVQRDRPQLNDLLKIRWDSQILGWFHSYFDTLHRYPHLLPYELQEKVNIDYIPNFNIFGGYDYELISNTATAILKIYEENRETWELNFHYNSCILEQLITFPMMRLIDDKYGESKIKDLNEDFKFNVSIMSFTETAPFKILDEGVSSTFVINGKKLKTFLKQDFPFNVRELVDYNFGGHTHLCSPYKESPHFLKMMKNKAIKYYGAKEIITKIEKRGGISLL